MTETPFATEAAADLLLVGCGKMGGAMLDGWLESGLLRRAVVVDPGHVAGGGDARVTRVGDIGDVPADFRPAVVVLAVKPQMMDAAAPAYRALVGHGAAVLSVAAGKSIAYYEALFGAEAGIVRAMPNTPAAIGRGITVAVANAWVDEATRTLCDRLLKAVGSVEWVEDEALIDAVTGLSGGGPAYVFLLIEAMAAAGAAAGLPAELAMRLARETVSGAGELARQSSESAAQLRRNVTSPNGTTQAALEVLMAPGAVPDLMAGAVAAATARSRELGR